ncbi:unnamed protein product [Nezara viridula]|uniref:Uncharacterized protein n=1 Tax=Nezara viridula TaxID=85310 RepID=A0A9P0H0C4_NEZVI|nr:unnamed protein product [Nezara viridula]
MMGGGECSESVTVGEPRGQLKTGDTGQWLPSH